MSNFFKFDKEGNSPRRTPIRIAATAVNPAQAIANRKLAETRIAQGVQSELGSPGRVISARPLTTIVNLDGSSKKEVSTGSPYSADPRDCSISSPGSQIPFQGGAIPSAGASGLSASPRASISLHTSAESAPSSTTPIVSASPPETEEIPLVRKKRHVSHPEVATSKRNRAGKEPALESVPPQSADECRADPIPRSLHDPESTPSVPVSSSSKKSKLKELHESEFLKNVGHFRHSQIPFEA